MTINELMTEMDELPEEPRSDEERLQVAAWRKQRAGEREAMRQLLQPALDDLNAGRGIEVNDAFWKNLRSNVRCEVANRKKRLNAGS